MLAEVVFTVPFMVIAMIGLLFSGFCVVVGCSVPRPHRPLPPPDVEPAWPSEEWMRTLSDCDGDDEDAEP